MSQEIETIRAYLKATGVAHRVTSTLRPGAVTAAGNLSRHALGLAVDFAGPQPGWNTPELLGIFKAFSPVEPLLHELIFSGAAYSIKAGRRVPRMAVSSHFDHVHVSVDRGMRLPVPDPLGGFRMPDDPNLPNIGELLGFYPITDINGKCVGYYLVSKSGEVHGHGPGAPYYGRSEVV